MEPEPGKEQVPAAVELVTEVTGEQVTREVTGLEEKTAAPEVQMVAYAEEKDAGPESEPAKGTAVVLEDTMDTAGERDSEPEMDTPASDGPTEDSGTEDAETVKEEMVSDASDYGTDFLLEAALQSSIR